MEKVIFKITAFTILFAASLSSCKKGSDNNLDPNTKLLIQQDWKLSKIEEKINADPYTDHFPSLPPCTQDDKYLFKTDNTYQLNEGNTKCSASDPDIISTGTWQFTSNETKIKIDANEFAIDQLDNNTLIISRNYFSNPDTEYYRYTFVH